MIDTFTAYDHCGESLELKLFATKSIDFAIKILVKTAGFLHGKEWPTVTGVYSKSEVWC